MTTTVCPNCGNALDAAARLSIHGMYDMHLFHRVEGRTVDEVIANWEAHNAVPSPAIVDGHEIDDLGQSWLCPVIVLDADDKELRRVGRGIHPIRSYEKDPEARYATEKAAFRKALLADPDIPRLLEEGCTGRP